MSEGMSSQVQTPVVKERAFNTDVGNAKRFVEMFGDRVLYCHPWKSWLVWNGLRWERDNTAEIVRMAKATVKTIYNEACAELDFERKKDLLKHAMASEAKSRINAMIEMAQSETGIPVLPEQLDKSLWLLNVQNGTIDLRTGKLREPSQGDYITKICSIPYDPVAKCPVWDGFLNRIMAGNQNLIKFIQKAIGYSLTGDTKEECIFIMFGTGSNGKSKFMGVLALILGEYSMRTDVNTLLEKKHDSPLSNDIARLRGARCVYASEPDAGKRLAEGKIKDLTGRDVITARMLYQEAFEFKPEFKLWLGTNHKPDIRGVDHGIWRRIKLIPFDVTIPDEEQDKDLESKLAAEAPGILAWAVQGCLDWQKEGLVFPQEVIDATNEYRWEMDSLGEFFNVCCEQDKSALTPHKIIYTAYKLWCGLNKIKIMSTKAFTQSMIERGYKVIHKREGNAISFTRVKDEVMQIVLKTDTYDSLEEGYREGCKMLNDFSSNFYISSPIGTYGTLLSQSSQNSKSTLNNQYIEKHSKECEGFGEGCGSVKDLDIVLYFKNKYDCFKKPENIQYLGRLINSMKLNLTVDFPMISEEQTEHFVKDYCTARGWI